MTKKRRSPGERQRSQDLAKTKHTHVPGVESPSSRGIDWSFVAALAGAALAAPYVVRTVARMINLEMPFRPSEIVDRVVETTRDLADRAGLEMPFSGGKETAEASESSEAITH